MKGIIYRTGIKIKEFGERKQWLWAYHLGMWIKERV